MSIIKTIPLDISFSGGLAFNLLKNYFCYIGLGGGMFDGHA